MSVAISIKKNGFINTSLALCLAAGLSGCGGGNGKNNTDNVSSSSLHSSTSSSSYSIRNSHPSSSSSSKRSSLSASSLSSTPNLLKNIKIWPVGDSITAGASNNWEHWSYENGGYRRNLMLLLNDGYTYQTIGGNSGDNPPTLGDLPINHSGYRGEGLSVLDKPEFSPEKITQNNPDAVLVMLGINSLGSKKEYPNMTGQYWSKNGNKFNNFFIKYKSFIDKVLTNSTNAKVFIAKLPPIGDTRFYHDNWDEQNAPNPTSGWTTVGDGSVNPKDIVPEFNTELQALYDTYYKDNDRVIIVDLNTGMTVGDKWEDDVTKLGAPQKWWHGDGLHPTYYGYRHIAERWNTAIRKAIPATTESTILYSVDCGAKEGTNSIVAEGAIKGSMQSVVWDKPYGPDASTGTNWGHIGEASYDSLTNKPANPTIWFGYEGKDSVFESVATSTAGNALVYRFEVPIGGTYRVHLGFHDTWADESKKTTREARVFIDGVIKATKTYQYKDFGRSIFEVTNTSGTLEVKVEGVSGDALLDSIIIQRAQ